MFKASILFLLIGCANEGLIDRYSTKIHPFYIHQDVPVRMHEAVLNAAQTWNEAIGHDVLIYEGVTTKKFKDSLTGDDHNVIYFYPNRKTEATATTYTKTLINLPFAWDIFLNTKKQDFQDVEKEQIAGFHVDKVQDTESILVHEFGHALGLEHVHKDDDFNSVMYPSFDGGMDTKKRELTTNEIKLIQKIWSL